MPSKNPRLSVVVSPALASTLAALSVETGESAASLVRGLLEQAEPALRRMLELVRATKAARGKIGGGVADSMHRVIDDLQDAVAVADARQARVVADLVDLAEGVRGRRLRTQAGGGRAAASGTPVPVTRGSGTGKTRRTGKESGS